MNTSILFKTLTIRFRSSKLFFVKFTPLTQVASMMTKVGFSSLETPSRTIFPRGVILIQYEGFSSFIYQVHLPIWMGE